MDSEKFPSEECLSSDLFKYYLEVSFLFTVYLSGPSIWQQCKITFPKSLHYSETSPSQDSLTKGPIHISAWTLCWACISCKVHEVSLRWLHP